MKPPAFRPLSIGGDEFCASLPGDLGQELEAAVEGEVFDVRGVWRGGTARVYLLRFARSGRMVVFKHVYAASRGSVEHEAAVYRAAASKLPPGRSIFPAIFSAVGPDALLMEFIRGRHVSGAVRYWHVDTLKLAETLNTALQSYYGLRDEAYGDFHPGNVLVRRDGSVALLDPLPPRWRRGQDRRVSDLGIWTFGTTVFIASDFLVSPRAAVQMLRLNARLILLALDDAPPELGLTVDDVQRSAAWHLARLKRGRLRDRINWLPARAVTWGLCSWVAWRQRGRKPTATMAGT